MPRYTSTSWIGAPVTESPTFPMIFPAAAAAGVDGTKSASSREMTTSVDVTARRKSVGFIRSLLREAPRGRHSGGGSTRISDELYLRKTRLRTCTSLVECQTLDRAIGRFTFARTGELINDATDDDDASPRSPGRRGRKRCPESRLRTPDLDVRERREFVHAKRQSSR